MMKKYILFLMFTLTLSNISLSQEWMTSLDAAKRIALVQDKMLLMIWEEAATIPYPVIMNNEKGNKVLFENLFNHPEINTVLWDYFVPVKVNETVYAELYDDINDRRSYDYMAQFGDDNFKVMDVNFNIVNRFNSPEAYFNLSEFISLYALNTSYLNTELENYSEHKDFNTAFRLASKYMDFAILAKEKIRGDILNLAELYLDDADSFIPENDTNEKIVLENKSNFLRMIPFLLENRPNKVLRQLKRFDDSVIDETNVSLVAFLNYTAYLLKEDEKNAEQWKSKVSLVNLRKAELITNIHL